MTYKMKGFSLHSGTEKHKEVVDRKQKRMANRLEKLSKKAYKSQQKDFKKSGGDSYMEHMAKGDHSKRTKRLHRRFEKIEDRLDEYMDKKEKSPAKQRKTHRDGPKNKAHFHDKRTTKDPHWQAHQFKDKYWYKVDGKKVTYKEYKAAKEKGVADPNSPNFTDGSGLQTNHPDPWGYKAKHKKDREKLKTKK